MKFDVIIIGGGAAGLFCAIEAGKRQRRVCLLEHNSEVGKKIVISGGGRCNFTHLNAQPLNFISENPHFCKSALARYTPPDFLELVKKHKIQFYEKTSGQLFARESSRQIVEMLLAECRTARTEIRLNTRVEAVSKADEVFTVKTNKGVLTSASLVVACGGLSIPKIGATDFGYQIARQFGLKIINTRPALVPLIFTGAETAGFANLAGISLETVAHYGATAFRENLLFTHRGVSGPAVLQISSYWKPHQTISFNLAPTADFTEILRTTRTSRQTLANFLSRYLPHRFAEVFCAKYFTNKPLNQLTNPEIQNIAAKIHDWQLKFDETEGYKKAEVTLGGVDTNELSSKTMEAKKVNGLYFIGEVVDVTGWLGGYNFQWAWSSGFVAGQFV